MVESLHRRSELRRFYSLCRVCRPRLYRYRIALGRGTRPLPHGQIMVGPLVLFTLRWDRVRATICKYVRFERQRLPFPDCYRGDARGNRCRPSYAPLSLPRIHLVSRHNDVRVY